jgi:hypothetical protein
LPSCEIPPSGTFAYPLLSARPSTSKRRNSSLAEVSGLDCPSNVGLDVKTVAHKS